MEESSNILPDNCSDFGHEAGKHDTDNDHDGVEAHDVEPARPQAPEYRVKHSDPEHIMG